VRRKERFGIGYRRRFDVAAIRNPEAIYDTSSGMLEKGGTDRLRKKTHVYGGDVSPETVVSSYIAVKFNDI